MSVLATASVRHAELERKKQEVVLRILILALIFCVAILARLFAVIRFESIIHEYDPWFNYRTTLYLVDNGWDAFLNWFDGGVWYPLGRATGGTMYPGLQVTAATMFHTLHAFGITVEIRHVCVFTSPFFASLTSMSCYVLAKEARNRSAGLLAAAFISIVPGYISRSVAGSFDNEGIAIFALVTVYALWTKAVKTGSIFWAAMCAIAYFYMALAWGGYIFIANLIPLYVFIMLLAGRYSTRLYIAYCTFYVLGTLFSMQIKFVGFQAVQSSEHMAAMGMFGLLQIVFFVDYLRSMVPPAQFAKFVRTFFLVVGAAVTAVIFAGFATGYVAPWTGRFYNLLDPTYAKEHIPIIASVSEHQPTTWSSFYFDLHILVFLFPVGLYFAFRDLTDAGLFVIVYGITSVYFAGVMVRLMLVLAPICCVMAAIGASATLDRYFGHIKSKDNEITKAIPFQRQISIAIIFMLSSLLCFFVFHCSWVTSEAYSSPSIVLAAKQPDGSRMIFDDFRETYYWLRTATAEDAKVASWWDYGYQLSGMANRTVFVDNNTSNTTHISAVARAFLSSEEKGAEILTSLAGDAGSDVYVLVLFGGLSGYSSEDFAKFPWMIRIAAAAYDDIKESDFLSADGGYAVDHRAPKKMINSLMYRMLFHRFGEVHTDRSRPAGWDRVRNTEIADKNIKLKYFEEAFTSQHWLVRVYKLLPPANRDPNAVGEHIRLSY